MPKPPRAVVFDLDGLMFNTEEIYRDVGGQLLGRRGKPFTPELIQATMGRPAQVALQMMIEHHRLSDTVEQLAAESADLFLELIEGRLSPMPGLLDLLAALEAAGMRKAIGTSSGRRLVTDMLSRFAFEPRFEFVLTSEDVVHGKPHPEIYLKAAGRLGIAPADVLVLEDSQNGCRAAVAAGTFAVAVPGEHSRGHDFSGASLVIEGLADRRLREVLGLE
jgi:HAD superfamily hydrolase (TIGR01509 family)